MLATGAARREHRGGDGHRRTFIRSTPAERSEGEGGRTLWPVELRLRRSSWLGHVDSRRGSEVMTEDRDFKNVVRARSAKTGESYQAARRQLERSRDAFSARVNTRFTTSDGRVVLGCTIEAGAVTRGMTVTVTTDDGDVHRGVVANLRHFSEDLDAVAHGERVDFGMVIDPAYEGPTPAQATGR
jgi:hypothetical protein